MLIKLDSPAQKLIDRSSTMGEGAIDKGFKTEYHTDLRIKYSTKM
jgi:hypothetical protein